MVVFFTKVWAEDYPDRSEVLRFNEQDHYIGNVKAKVVLIEYSALSCPGCASFHRDVFPKIKEHYIDSGEVLYILRDYPANEPALYGAILANCFPQEYFRIIDVLFNSQNSWAFRKDFKKVLQNISRLSGLNPIKLKQCFENKDMANLILAKSYTSMKVLEINHTPTFLLGVFINR
ncbi:thioredoxin domain-containing protein [Candidatus Bandiella euplotis]|uniref:thioredoxin domain-containing protein n=1 Tax=Candidatus Bandiella euplotis TaxID=1664265 RepID=UPI002B259781|nr:thioredoxin domain-containing protein [Candidatus Bandiella woodruffii]